MMKEVHDFPPIYDEASKLFDLRGRNVVFAYGDAIYNPAKVVMDDDLMVHESVHLMQQKAMGGPEKWWRRYLDDPAFRLAQEIPAYKVQYQYYCTRVKGREQRYQFLSRLAADLSSPMYKCPISYMAAIMAIK